MTSKKVPCLSFKLIKCKDKGKESLTTGYPRWSLALEKISWLFQTNRLILFFIQIDEYTPSLWWKFGLATIYVLFP